MQQALHDLLALPKQSPGSISKATFRQGKYQEGNQELKRKIHRNSCDFFTRKITVKVLSPVIPTEFVTS